MIIVLEKSIHFGRKDKRSWTFTHIRVAYWRLQEDGTFLDHKNGTRASGVMGICTLWSLIPDPFHGIIQRNKLGRKGLRSNVWLPHRCQVNVTQQCYTVPIQGSCVTIWGEDQESSYFQVNPSQMPYLSVHQHIWGFVSHPVTAVSVVIPLCHVLILWSAGKSSAQQSASVKIKYERALLSKTFPQLLLPLPFTDKDEFHS